MSKVRVYELAKELNKSSKAIVEKAHTMGIDVNNHMSSLEDDEVVKIQNAFKGQKSAPKRPVETREKNRKAEANQKPQGQKPQGQKPQGQKPQGQKPQGQKPQGQKPQGQKPQGQKPSNKPNNKPANKPQQKPQGNKTAVAKTEAKESASKRRDHSGGTQQKDFRKGGNRNTGGRKRGFEKKKRTKYKKERVEEVVIEDDSIIIPAKLSVGDLAERLNKNANEIIMKLMGLGVMAALNAEIDFDTAELIANEYEIPVKKEIMEGANIVLDEEYDDTPEQMVKRAPVVTVMGHVDHGKTSLLDAIRSSGVADGEAGGITQHIGASEIVHNGEKIVFLDTPGHEAFTTLRARGAQITDIAILVVAADDGVMPQTIEAIDHAKAAGVPIIVALNKIDKANANPDFVKKGLSENGILIEEWGGDIICVPVSALKGENIEQLLEMVLIVAEMEELRANPNRPAVGTIIEAKVEKGRGSVATILIEKGTMKVGDSITAGSAFGRVRAMFNHLGKKVTVAGPATSVEVIGLGDVPQAGDKIYVTKDDKRARYLAESNADILRERMMNKTTHVSLDDLFSQIMEGSIKDLNIIIKADVHGSDEAIRQSLMKLSNDEVRVNIIHGNVGTISESDIMLAASSNAIIIGFNVRPSASVSHMAEAENVDLRTYRIIYDAINDVETAMKGMLDPEFKEVVLGQVEVRETFKVPNVGVIAGGYVINGKVARNAEMRLVRDGIVIFEGKVSSLRRFKDDVKEVAQGYECGIGLERYNDLKEGDIIEAFIIEEIKRS